MADRDFRPSSGGLWIELADYEYDDTGERHIVIQDLVSWDTWDRIVAQVEQDRRAIDSGSASDGQAS